MDVDFAVDPIGVGSDGEPVFLRDIWPSTSEVEETVARANFEYRASVWELRHEVVPKERQETGVVWPERVGHG